MRTNRPARAHPRQGERPDRTPVNKPLGFTQPPSIRDQVAAAIRYHTEMARAQHAESFEEADDFTDSEIPEFGTGHELPDDVVQLAAWSEKGARAEALRAAHDRFLPPQGQHSPGGQPAPADGPPVVAAVKTA